MKVRTSKAPPYRGGEMLAIDAVEPDVLDSTSVDVVLAGAPHRSERVEYRVDGGDWKRARVYGRRFHVFDLEPDTEYDVEARIAP